MKKLLVYILLLLASPLYATTYYADSGSANASAITWHATSGGNCVTGSGATLAWGSGASTDTFDANGCTSIAITSEPGSGWSGASAGVCGTGGTTPTIETNATNGGSFTYVTAANIIIHANVTATKTVALSITGSTGGGTICGNITGGSVANQYAVSDSHATITLYYVGNITGGSASKGISTSGATGYTVIIGNATGGSGNGTQGFLLGGNATATIQGNCIGGSMISESDAGCECTGTGGITVVGDIINSLGSMGATGRIYFTPGITNYFLAAKDSSYTTGTNDTHATPMVPNPGVTNVKSGVNYGPYTGTLSTTGGGSNGYAY